MRMAMTARDLAILHKKPVRQRKSNEGATEDDETIHIRKFSTRCSCGGEDESRGDPTTKHDDVKKWIEVCIGYARRPARRI